MRIQALFCKPVTKLGLPCGVGSDDQCVDEEADHVVERVVGGAKARGELKSVNTVATRLQVSAMIESGSFESQLRNCGTLRQFHPGRQAMTMVK